MKKYLVFAFIYALVITPLTGQTHKTIEIVTPGTLSNALTPGEKSEITHLTVTGTIDSMDFVSIKEELSQLSVLDLSGASTVNNILYDDAFMYKYCDTILLPSTITRIGNQAFLGCNFRTITIPPSVTLIEHAAFAYCPLETINIPASVQEIEDNVFAWCSSMLNITVEEDNTVYCDVDGVLFSKNMAVLVGYPQGRTGKYEIPSTVEEIGYEAFANALYIDTLVIPGSLSKIERLGLYGCKLLTDIQVDETSATFRDIDGILFSKDSKTLVRYPSNRPGTQYDIPHGVTILGENSFESCTRLNDVSFPVTLLVVEEAAFRACFGLISLELPPSLTTLGPSAFYSCKFLRTMRIPSSVNSIGKRFLSNSEELDTLVLNSSEPVELHSNTRYFDMVDTNFCILLVPAGSADAYRNAVQWKSFVNIVEYDFSFEVSQTEFSSEAIGSTATCSITSNTEWRITSDDSWISISDTLGMNSKSITLTVAANAGSGDRQGIVHINPLGKSPVDITIIQSGLPTAVSQTDQNSMLVYMAENMLHITGAKDCLLQILSVDGKLWFSKRITENEETLSVSNLPDGVYLIKAGQKTIKVVK